MRCHPGMVEHPHRDGLDDDDAPDASRPHARAFLRLLGALGRAVAAGDEDAALSLSAEADHLAGLA